MKRIKLGNDPVKLAGVAILGIGATWAIARWASPSLPNWAAAKQSTQLPETLTNPAASRALIGQGTDWLVGAAQQGLNDLSKDMATGGRLFRFW
jgi:hypothetical protein